MKVTKKTRLLAKPRILSVSWERSGRGDEPNTLVPGYASNFDGENLDTVEGIAWRDDSRPDGQCGVIAREHWSVNSDGTVLTLDGTVAGAIKDVTGAGGIISFTFTSHGGVPGSAEQTVGHGGLVFGS